MKKLLLISSMVLILTSCSLTNKESGPVPQDGKPNKDYQASIDNASSKIKNTAEFADCMAPAVNSCVSSVGMRLAQEKKDPSMCSELPQKEQQEGCVFALVVREASEKGDVTACNKLSGNYQKQCSKSIYRTIAIQKKDITLCEKIASSGVSGEANPMIEQEYDQCVLNIIMTKDDASEKDCLSIKNDNMKNMCANTIKNKPSRLPPR